MAQIERNKKRLTLNSEYDKFFIEGFNSFMAGEPMSYNIYNNREYDKWLEGYVYAYEYLKKKQDE